MDLRSGRCTAIAGVFGVDVLLGDRALVGRVPRLHISYRLEFEQLLGAVRPLSSAMVVLVVLVVARRPL